MLTKGLRKKNLQKSVFYKSRLYAVAYMFANKYYKKKHQKMKKLSISMMAAAVLLISSQSFAQTMTKEKTVEVGGAAMYPSKDIVSNAVNSKDHTTLVAAVKAAGLVETLQSAGPFTVFAPTNAAFNLLPDGTVATLFKPENKAALSGVLTYHVLAGKFTAKDVANLIKAGNGKASVTTVAGGTLILSMEGKKLAIQDEKGGKAYVTIADVNQSNGVIHVIDHVLLPK